MVASLLGCAQPKPVVLNSDMLVDAPVRSLSRAALGADTAGARFDHAAWGRLLADAVAADGTVDYARIKRREGELNAYLVDVGNVRLEALSRYERMALLINAYNACTIKMIVENPGLKAVTDLPAARGWQQVGWVIDRTGVSLQQLEQDYIRRYFPDPRVNLLLVRGARGSAPLQREPYTGAALARQMDEQARRVLADPRYCAWDGDSNTLRLGGVFERHRADFGDGDAALIRSLYPWMPDLLRLTLKARTTIALEFASFDWRLNGTW
ncbi:MAG TPA: DUF547 domain-containing protein [Kiritimatiellia bacterium]|nr:DUF547 domain-containing protein [Kiritimatiellia bacterium]